MTWYRVAWQRLEFTGIANADFGGLHFRGNVTFDGSTFTGDATWRWTTPPWRTGGWW